MNLVVIKCTHKMNCKLIESDSIKSNVLIAVVIKGENNLWYEHYQ